MRKIRFGAAGNAGRLEMFLEAADEAQIDVRAIWTKEPGKKQALKIVADYGIPTHCDAYEELLRDDSIEAVYIALPGALRFAYALQAILSGKHVLLDRPFTANHREAETLMKAAREQQCWVFEVSAGRHQDIYDRLESASAQIGDIKLVQLSLSQLISRPDGYSRNGELLLSASAGEADLLDLAVSNLHFLLGLFGMPVDFSYHVHREGKLDSSGVLVMDYPGFLAVAAASRDSFGQSNFSLQGTSGFIRSLESPASFTSFVRVRPDGTEKPESTRTIESAFCSELKNIQDLVVTGNVDAIDKRLEPSLNALKIIDEIRRRSNPANQNRGS